MDEHMSIRMSLHMSVGMFVRMSFRISTRFYVYIFLCVWLRIYFCVCLCVSGFDLIGGDRRFGQLSISENPNWITCQNAKNGVFRHFWWKFSLRLLWRGKVVLNKPFWGQRWVIFSKKVDAFGAENGSLIDFGHRLLVGKPPIEPWCVCIYVCLSLLYEKII